MANWFENFKKVFTEEQEKKIENRFFSIILKHLREIDFDLAEKSFSENYFERNAYTVGWKCVEVFLRNHIVSLRKPVGISGAKAMRFNRVSVNQFSYLVTETMDRHQFTPMSASLACQPFLKKCQKC